MCIYKIWCCTSVGDDPNQNLKINKVDINMPLKMYILVWVDTRLETNSVTKYIENRDSKLYLLLCCAENQLIYTHAQLTNLGANNAIGRIKGGNN